MSVVKQAAGFRFEESEDSTVDSQWVRIDKPSVAIQFAPYAWPLMFSVGLYDAEEGCLYHHGEFSSLDAAADKARTL